MVDFESCFFVGSVVNRKIFCAKARFCNIEICAKRLPVEKSLCALLVLCEGFFFCTGKLVIHDCLKKRVPFVFGDFFLNFLLALKAVFDSIASEVIFYSATYSVVNA